jgi:hypothetical protein
MKSLQDLLNKRAVPQTETVQKAPAPLPKTLTKLQPTGVKKLQPIQLKPAQAKSVALDKTLHTDVLSWPEIKNTANQDTNKIEAELRHLLLTLSHTIGTDACVESHIAVWQFCKQNPQTAQYLKPEDISLLVKALQQSANIVIANKVERRGKREGKDIIIDTSVPFPTFT